MAAPPPVPRPTWTRRAPGWAFAAFFASLIVLTYLAVFDYNRGDLVTTGYLAGLASVVPVLVVVAVYHLVPLWAIPVPLPVEAVAGVLSAATRDRRVEAVEDRQGPFARCVSVVRFEAPACTVGWFPMSQAAQAAPAHPRSTVVLRPETRDRKALAEFRETLARALLERTSTA